MYKPFIFLAFLIAPVTFSSAATVESEVRSYFSDTPIMIEIARCESGFRQFTDSGSVLWGGSDNRMVGVFQFFGSIHQEAALELGYDILTTEGNLDYAKHLYQQEGTTPWNSARTCWENKSGFESTNVDIIKLQQKLALLLQLLELLEKLEKLQSH